MSAYGDAVFVDDGELEDDALYRRDFDDSDATDRVDACGTKFAPWRVSDMDERSTLVDPWESPFQLVWEDSWLERSTLLGGRR